jgi:hypothetical protein
VGDAELALGVVVGEGPLPLWALRCLEALVAVPGARLRLVLRCGGEAAPGRAWAIVDWAARRRSCALRPAGAGALLDGVPEVACGPAAIGPAGVEALAAADLDVVVDLCGADGIVPLVGAHARHGAWALAFGPERTGPAGPVGAADLLERRPTAIVRLVAHCGGGHSVVLRRGTLRTVAHSWRRHRDQLLLDAVGWPALGCRDLLAGRSPAHDPAGADGERATRAVEDARAIGASGAAAATGAVGGADTTRPARPLRPGRLAWSLAANRAARLLRAFRDDRWHVGVVDAPISAFLHPEGLPAPTWLPRPPRHAYYADPFPCPDGRSVIVERFELRRRAGSLCRLDLDVKADGRTGRTGRAGRPRHLATPTHHVSYPYVVEEAGVAYVTPETAELGEVGLYRLLDGPPRMEKVATLVDGFAAVDPTIVRHGGRWWLFFTDGGLDPDAALHAWYADRLLGPWRPHARNPVTVDVRCGRPAGTPFTYDGALYRPAMDNSSSYGGRVVITRVLELTPDAFTERMAAVVPPFPGRFGDGLHTIAGAGPVTVVDGKRTTVVPTALPAKFRYSRRPHA